MQSSYSAGQKKGLCPNFLEIYFNQSHTSVHRTPYTNDKFEKLLELLPDYFFYKYRENDQDWIYAWPRKRTEDQLTPDFKPVEITTKEDCLVFAKILEEAIVQFFRSKDYDIFKKKYSSIWFVYSPDEKHHKLFQGLKVIPTLGFAVHNLYSKLKKEQVIAVSIQQEYKHRFCISETELQNQHIDFQDWDRNHKGLLVASPRNRRIYLEATNQTIAYKQYFEQKHSDNSQYSSVERYQQKFQRVRDLLILPGDLKVEKFQLSNLPSSKFVTQDIDKPRYYYYNERVGYEYYDVNVSKLCPSSYDQFRNRNIRILALSPREHEGDIGEIIYKIRNNLKSIFHIDNIEFQTVTFQNPPDGYIEALQHIDLKGYDLAILPMEESYKNYPIHLSPYHRTKSKLLNQRIVSQDILLKNIRSNNPSIAKSIALNIYSKLGGTAWTVEKSEKDIPELVIGIGSTIDESGNTIIGFANVFDRNGTYIVGDCSQLTSKENYATNLEIYLKKSIQTAIEVKGIAPQQSIRLIFHLFKGAAKRYEIAAIEGALRAFRSYSIQYGIAHLSRHHNFRMFLDGGHAVIKRGKFLQISTRQGLLHLGNKNTIPLLIHIDKRSTYSDLYATTKQVLYFCHLSYRSFKPANEPVTLCYPRKMAKLTSELRQLNSWDPDVLNHLNDILWFI